MIQTAYIDDVRPASASDCYKIRAGLRAFNNQHLPESDPEPVEFVLRDEEDGVCGGIIGCTRWHWLLIHILWVHEDHRNQGHGKALLAKAEQYAIGHGCKFSALDTTDFQALDFYKSQGYRPYGELPDFPPGSRTVYLVKKLSE